MVTWTWRAGSTKWQDLLKVPRSKRRPSQTYTSDGPRGNRLSTRFWGISQRGEALKKELDELKSQLLGEFTWPHVRVRWDKKGKAPFWVSTVGLP